MTDQTKTKVIKGARSSRKPSPRQRKAAVAVVENAMSDKPKPTGQVLADVGYGTIVQDPSRITESIGFKTAMGELGLTEDLIATSLVADIKKKKGKRYHELKLGAEILGMVKRAPDESPKTPTNATYNFIFSAETQAEVKAIEERIKAQLLRKHEPTPQS